MTTFPVPAGSRATTALLNHAYSISDVDVTTVTAASYTDLSSIYAIPAGDAALGVSYELFAHGYGTTGSTAQTMQFGAQFGGSIVGIAPVIGSTAFGTSEAFRWAMTIELTPDGSSSTTGWAASLRGTVTQSANNVLPGAGNQDSVPIAGGNSTLVTVDATASQSLSLRFQWGSATGSPTITCMKTRFTRLG